MKQKPIYVYHAIMDDGREVELEKADPLTYVQAIRFSRVLESGGSRARG